jgi:DNA end-binding protein Ku
MKKTNTFCFDKAELDKIAPESARSMEILEFVKEEQVDPLYYDASYYITPEEAGTKAYQLLVTTMEDSGYAAIAQVTMHQHEYIAVIRPRAKGMTLHTMFYPNEIRQIAEYGQTEGAAPKEQEKKLATQLVESLASDFEPEKYKDRYQERMLQLISAKQQGREIAESLHPKLAPVVDLMEALKKSIQGNQTTLGAKKPPTRAPAVQTPKKTRRKLAS